MVLSVNRSTEGKQNKPNNILNFSSIIKASVSIELQNPYISLYILEYFIIHQCLFVMYNTPTNHDLAQVQISLDNNVMWSHFPFLFINWLKIT